MAALAWNHQSEALKTGYFTIFRYFLKNFPNILPFIHTCRIEIDDKNQTARIFKTDCRTLKEVEESFLLSFVAGIGKQTGIDRRLAACLEVLRRIPQKDFKILANKLDEFQWFIPFLGIGAV